MSSNVAALLPCDGKVFKEGKLLCLASTGEVGGARKFDAWVKLVRERSGQQVDWHYHGGIARVLYLGDYEKVYDAANIERVPDGITLLEWHKG
jgi:hypothetical protein